MNNTFVIRLFICISISITDLTPTLADTTYSSSEVDTLQTNLVTKKPRRKIIRSPMPEFSRQYQDTKAAYHVMLNILISETGYIQKAEIEKSSGIHILDSTALESVRKWIFEPRSYLETQSIKITFHAGVNKRLRSLNNLGKAKENPDDRNEYIHKRK